MLEDIREAKRVQELTAQAAERLRVMVENLSVGAVQVRSTLLVMRMLVNRGCACFWIEFEGSALFKQVSNSSRNE
jgi:hypothetical protein